MNKKAPGTYVLEHLQSQQKATARYPKAALRIARKMGGLVQIVFVPNHETNAPFRFTQCHEQINDEHMLCKLRRIQIDLIND